MGTTTDFDQLEQAKKELRRFMRFDPQINMGHILQIVVLIFGIFAAYNNLDKRQEIMDQKVKLLESESEKKSAMWTKALDDLRDDMKDSSRKIDELNVMVRTRIAVTDQTERGRR
jgi:hypothetical protein